ncbi:hypothetical protein K458DRAFT_391524 [Lentithecium fluviatile CBS 122367]|uniref:Beta/gamma crystallin 'Greek key' domain-containing protein n=1 Tax=Lentithecium fluviatile CBS 122367 TaxID=1168545 RepID=A0A6G1IUT0_9PLEO|nr:hypothetical protein K458DRAFT_391524 [Lentithecium fluviatile CBS 122367]
MQFKMRSSLLVTILATTTLGAVIEPTPTAIKSAVPVPTGEDENFSAAASNLITVCKDKKIIFVGKWNDVASFVRAWNGHWCYIYQGANYGGYRGGPVQDDNAHDDLGAVKWNDVTSAFMCFSK